MIKVLHYPLETTSNVEETEEQLNVNLEPNIKYELKKEPNALVVQFETSRKGHLVQGDIFFPYDEYKGKIIQIAVTSNSLINDIRIFPVYEYVHRETFTVTKKNDDTMVARIAFNDDCSDIVVFLNSATDDILGFDNIVLNPNENCMTGYLAEYSVFCAKRLSKLAIKSKMINEVDCYASLSYLEAQVDLLTKILKDLVLPLCSNNKNYLVDLLLAADKYSVLNIKNPQSIEEEFAENKAKIRKLQEIYYANKNNA